MMHGDYKYLGSLITCLKHLVLSAAKQPFIKLAWSVWIGLSIQYNSQSIMTIILSDIWVCNYSGPEYFSRNTIKTFAALFFCVCSEFAFGAVKLSPGAHKFWERKFLDEHCFAGMTHTLWIQWLPWWFLYPGFVLYFWGKVLSQIQ